MIKRRKKSAAPLLSAAVPYETRRQIGDAHKYGSKARVRA